MAILFLNNIQKKLFAEAFKLLDFATPILGAQSLPNLGPPIVASPVQLQLSCKAFLSV